MFVVDTTRSTGVFDQLFTIIPSFERLLAKIPLLTKPVLVMENIIDFSLGWLHLLPLHFSLLFKLSGTNITSVDFKHHKNLIDILACPSCLKTNLSKQENVYKCSGCGNIYPIRDRILDFRLGKTNG